MSRQPGPKAALNRGLAQTAAAQAMVLCGLLLAAFQIYTALFGALPEVYQCAVHWGLLACFSTLGVLAKAPAWQGKAAKTLWRLLSLGVLAATILPTLYACLNFETVFHRLGNSTGFDLFCGMLLLISVIAVGCQTTGRLLPALAVLFILYAFCGHRLPGLLNHRELSLERIVSFLYLGTEGVYGIALNVSTTYIYLFVMLGVFMDHCGGGSYLVALAQRFTRKITGGPAETAVLSGALMGLVSGSSIANSVTLGTFTLPILKQSGYSNEEAGAIQAAGTNVGQLLPPVMGGGMFLLIDVLGSNYLTVAKAAILPSLVYCLVTAVVVRFDAKNRQAPGALPAVLSPAATPGMLKKGLFYLLPFVVMVAFLVLGSTAVKAGIYAVLTMAVLGLFNPHARICLRQYPQVFTRIANTLCSITPACACAGIIIGMMTLTNLGTKVTALVIAVSGGSLYIALLLLMLAALLLGMVLPTSAVYLVLAVLGGPALVGMGAEPLSAHLFLGYYAIFAALTPPVGLNTMAVCALSGGNFLKTCCLTIKYSLPVLAVPFVWIRYSGLLLTQGLPNALLPLAFALLSGVLLAAAVFGRLGRQLSKLSRLLLAAAGLGLAAPAAWALAAGGVSAIVLLAECYRQKKQQITS